MGQTGTADPDVSPSRVTQVPPSRRAARVELLAARLRWLGQLMLHPELRPVGLRVMIGRGGSWKFRGHPTVRIGPGVALRPGYYVYVQGTLTIGAGTFVNRGAYISAFGDVCIGADVRFGERCSIHDENHVFEPLPVSAEQRHAYSVAPIRIGDRAWIGANCVILPGAVIGEDAVIAANSVVRGRIPARTIAAGSPARVIRSLTPADGDESAPPEGPRESSQEPASGAA